MLAFVLVAIAGTKEDNAFRKSIRRLPEVLECHAVTGGWSYLLKLRLAALEQLEAFVAGQLRTMAGVDRVDSWLATSSVKETAMVPPAG